MLGGPSLFKDLVLTACLAIAALAYLAAMSCEPPSIGDAASRAGSLPELHHFARLNAGAPTAYFSRTPVPRRGSVEAQGVRG